MARSAAQLIGARVRYLRELRGLTQQELSVLSQTSVATVNRIENGGQNFSFDRLSAIIQALDVQAQEFFTTIDQHDSPILALIAQAFETLSVVDRKDLFFVLGKFLEGKGDAQIASLLRQASHLRREDRVIT